MAATQGALYVRHLPEPTLSSWAIAVLVIASAIALISGFMTPGAAAVLSAGMLVVAAAMRPGWPGLDEGAALLVIVDALALAVLGPGAYSVDAYLFGRREIVISDDFGHR